MESANLRAAPVLSAGKLSYFKKLLVQTVLGGYQFSDEESGIELSNWFQLLQLFLYLFFPLVVFICGIISFHNDRDFIIGGLVPAVINSIANLGLQLYAKRVNRQILENDNLLVESSTKMFAQIIKPKSLLNLLYSILAMPAVSFLAANFIGKGSNVAVQILTLITCTTSFFSLVSSSPPEFTATSSENTEISQYSSAHMRTHHFLVLLIINLSLDTSSNHTVFQILIPLLPLIWALGMLGNLYVSVIYCIEKFSQYLLGASETSSTDTRLILSTGARLLVILIISLIVNAAYGEDKPLDRLRLVTLLTSIAAFLLSLNFLWTLGLQKTAKPAQLNIYYSFFNKLALLASSIIFPLIFSQDSSVSTGRIMCLISLILFVINYLSQLTQNAYVSARLSGFTDKINRFGCIIQQIIYTAAISQLGVNAAYTFIKYDFTAFHGARIFIQTLLIFRMFMSTYSNPLVSGLMLAEIYIFSVIWDDRATYLLTYSPLIHAGNIALANVLRRLIIWIHSIVRMNTSKKQRIARQSIFNALSFSILLPVNLLGICLSSILDTPFLPFMGLPLYFTGFPRPKRFWPEAKHVVKQSGESLLYEKFTDNFKSQFGSALRKRNAQVGDFFLIRIEKYLATVQVLENGQNYAIVSLRGLESQEMTSCHSIEANQVDRITEEVYVKKQCYFKDWFGSLKPLQQLAVKTYEENQLQFTGIITDSGFIKGYKELLMRVIVYFINKVVALEEDEVAIDLLLQSYSDYVSNLGLFKEKFPKEFSQLINFNLSQKKTEYQAEIEQFHQTLKQPEEKKKTTKHPANNQGKSNGTNIQQQAPGKFTLEEDMDDFFGGKNKKEQNIFAPKKDEQKIGNIQMTISNKKNNDVLGEEINYGFSMQKNKAAEKPQQIIVKPSVQQEKKGGNELDDLLDDLSMKSQPKTKKESKPQMQVANSNPFNIPKPQVQMERQRTPKKENLGVEMAGDYSQIKALSSASKAITDQKQAALIAAPQLESKEMAIKPKELNLFEHQEARQGQRKDIQAESQMEIKESNSDKNDLDDLKKLLDGDSVESSKNSKQNQEQLFMKQQQLMPSPQTGGNYNYLDDSANNNKNKVNKNNISPDNSFVNQSAEIGVKQNNNQPQQPKTPAAVQNNGLHEKDDIDDFLAEFANDNHDFDLRPKASAPPPMMIDLEDDVAGSNGRAAEEKTPPKIGHSQTNTRVSGGNYSPKEPEHNPKMKGTNLDGMTEAQKEKAMKLTYLLYSLCTNDSNFTNSSIDQELLFKNFKDTTYLSSLRVFQKLPNTPAKSKLLFIANSSVRYAIKLAYDTFAYMGSLDDVADQDVLDSIDENNKECVIGMGSDAQWKKAVEREIPTLWQLHYNQAESGVSIFRSQYKEISCSLFSLDEHVVTSIWANLAFELYYATNDDDERYSIQTHEQFFRNIIIQSAEEPLGYSPYYSGPIMIPF